MIFQNEANIHRRHFSQCYINRMVQLGYFVSRQYGFRVSESKQNIFSHKP